MIKQHIYMLYDAAAELPLITMCSAADPESFLEVYNRQCVSQPLPNMEDIIIYEVASFDSDIGIKPPFTIIGDLSQALKKLEDLKNARSRK